MSRKHGLADPSSLKPFASADKALLRVVIETPKGSRNKFALNADEHIFELKKVLPAGMAFPYDFGFLPSTKPDNGDLVDALALMDEPAFPRCALKTSRSASSRASRATRREGSKRSNSLPPRHRSPGTCGLPFSMSICTILG